jgi:predicted component of type VI protein secretion system
MAFVEKRDVGLHGESWLTASAAIKAKIPDRGNGANRRRRRSIAQNRARIAVFAAMHVTDRDAVRFQHRAELVSAHPEAFKRAR